MHIDPRPVPQPVVHAAPAADHLILRDLQALRRETIEALAALAGVDDPGCIALKAHLRAVLAAIDRQMSI